jgi:hypothetical protein
MNETKTEKPSKKNKKIHGKKRKKRNKKIGETSKN